MNTRRLNTRSAQPAPAVGVDVNISPPPPPPPPPPRGGGGKKNPPPPPPPFTRGD